MSEWTFGVYLPNIADDSPPTSLLSLKTKNVESIQYELNTNFQNYVNVNLHPDSYLISIELTDDFANYEENEVNYSNMFSRNVTERVELNFNFFNFTSQRIYLESGFRCSAKQEQIKTL